MAEGTRRAFTLFLHSAHVQCMHNPDACTPSRGDPICQKPLLHGAGNCIGPDNATCDAQKRGDPDKNRQGKEKLRACSVLCSLLSSPGPFRVPGVLTTSGIRKLSREREARQCPGLQLLARASKSENFSHLLPPLIILCGRPFSLRACMPALIKASCLLSGPPCAGPMIK